MGRSLKINDTKRLDIRKTFGHAGVPPRFMVKEFGSFEVGSDAQAKALQIAQGYANSFDGDLHRGCGLIFIGPTGTGKTHLAAAICKEVIRREHTALFTSVLECMQVIKESYRPGSDSSEREAIAKFVAPDLLVLDEVGVQRGSDTENMLLTELMNQRYSKMKPTILLSNLNGGEIGKAVGERVFSRLKEVSKVVVCNWEDYRTRALA